MLQTINSLPALRRYTEGVRDRATHHGPEVDAIWPCLLGYAMVYASAPIEVRSSRGVHGTANQAWAMINGRRISFSYRRKPTKRIDACLGHTRMKSFNNNTKLTEVKRFFDGL